MNFLEIDEVYRIHEQILSVSIGRPGVRDFALLHSAVERPRATFQGQYLYPTLFAKAAALLQSSCLNHGFFDANKRTAWGATKWFLALNGYHLKVQRHEAADFMVHVDNDKPEIQEIHTWLKSHSIKIE